MRPPRRTLGVVRRGGLRPIAGGGPGPATPALLREVRPPPRRLSDRILASRRPGRSVNECWASVRIARRRAPKALPHLIKVLRWRGGGCRGGDNRRGIRIPDKGLSDRRCDHVDPAAVSGTAWLSQARELEVLELVARGLDNDQVDAELCISPRTAANHASSILAREARRDTPRPSRRLRLAPRLGLTRWLGRTVPRSSTRAGKSRVGTGEWAGRARPGLAPRSRTTGFRRRTRR